MMQPSLPVKMADNVDGEKDDFKSPISGNASFSQTTLWDIGLISPKYSLRRKLKSRHVSMIRYVLHVTLISCS